MLRAADKKTRVRGNVTELLAPPVVLGGDCRGALSICPGGAWSFGPAFCDVGPTAVGWEAANQSLLVPFRVPVPVVVTHLACATGTGTTGNFDLGIYDEKLALKVSTGSTAKTTASSERIVDVTDTVLMPGFYYLAMATDGTTNYQFFGAPTNLGFYKFMGLRQATSNFPLAASPTLATVTSARCPTISAYLRAAPLDHRARMRFPPANVITPYHPESTGPLLPNINVVTDGAVSGAPGANVVMYWPFVVYERTIAQKMSYIVGATSNGNVDLGIYSSDGTRLVNSGTVAQGTINTLQEVDITDTTLLPGVYFMAIQFSSASGTIFRHGLADEILQSMMLIYSEALGGFGLPSSMSFTISTAATALLPALAVHFSSLI